MNFKESKAIYLQIADRICDEILLGQFGEEERIPSVREYAAIVEVKGIDSFFAKGYFFEGGIGLFFQADQDVGYSYQRDNRYVSGIL